jgi:hypothetical protein
MAARGSTGLGAEEPAELCLLPDASGAGTFPIPGATRGQGFSWTDPDDDMLDAQADIVAVGWVPVMLSRAEARKLARSGEFVTRGNASKVISAGNYVLIQVVTREKPATDPRRNLSFHLGTDRHGDRTRRSPSTVIQPLSPLAGARNAYTVFLGQSSTGPAAYSTDFAGKLVNGSPWYNDTTPFAARISDAPAGIQYLVPAKNIGTEFRVVSYTDEDGATPPAGEGPALTPGFDALDVGRKLGPLPLNGMVGARLGCVDVELVHERVILESISFGDGAEQEDAELPSHMPVTGCFFVRNDEREDIEAFLDEVGDEEGVAHGSIQLTVYEGGRILHEVVDLDVLLEDGMLYLEFPVGITQYGYHAVLDVEVMPTGSGALDALLEDAALELIDALDPTVVTEDPGLIQGTGECREVA